jgi:host factor-I protein
MAKTWVNLQDSFLNQVRKDNSEVKVVLLDGSSLSGTVRGFDNFTLVLHSQGTQHLIYKHAIAQLVTNRNARKNSSAAAPVDSAKRESGFNTIDVSKIKIEK